MFLCLCHCWVALEDRYPIRRDGLSRFFNGERRISESALAGLKMLFFINPKYITGESNDMYSLSETALGFYFPFIKEIVITGNNKRKDKNEISEKYLHFKMHNKLYEQLICLDSIDAATEDMTLELKDKISNLKYIFTDNPKEYSDYVLLPKKVLFEIIDNENKDSRHIKRPDFEELIHSFSDKSDLIHVLKRIKLNRK